MKKYDLLVEVRSYAFLKVEASTAEEAQYIAQLQVNEMALKGVDVDLKRLNDETVTLNSLHWEVDVHEVEH